MRCPNCNKFVSYDTEVEPDVVSDPEVAETTLVVTVRRVLSCAECGDELKEAELEVEQELEFFRSIEQPDVEKAMDAGDAAYEALGEAGAIPGHSDGCGENSRSYDFSLDYAPTEEAGGRYAKTYYGVEVSGTVTCETCSATAEVNASVKEAASFFDELV